MSANCESDKCNAYCCRYISIHLDPPRSHRDFDEIRWFVAHENITVYKDSDNDWIVEVLSPCQHLEDNRCTIYEKRPTVCRKYDPEVCTYNAGELETKVIFKTSEDVEKYIENRWKKNTSPTKKKGKD